MRRRKGDGGREGRKGRERRRGGKGGKEGKEGSRRDEKQRHIQVRKYLYLLPTSLDL